MESWIPNFSSSRSHLWRIRLFTILMDAFCCTIRYPIYIYIYIQTLLVEHEAFFLIHFFHFFLKSRQILFIFHLLSFLVFSSFILPSVRVCFTTNIMCTVYYVYFQVEIANLCFISLIYFRWNFADRNDFYFFFCVGMPSSLSKLHYFCSAPSETRSLIYIVINFFGIFFSLFISWTFFSFSSYFLLASLCVHCSCYYVLIVQNVFVFRFSFLSSFIFFFLLFQHIIELDAKY